jgi:uncharacterized lipoprotein YajG
MLAVCNGINPEQMRRILTARSDIMKYMLFLVMAVVALVGCGAGHANLTSITVSPQSATTTSNPQGQVGQGSSATKTPRVSPAVACRRGSRDTVLEPVDMTPLILSVLPRAVRGR